MGCDLKFSRRHLLSALPLLPAARLLRGQESQKPSFSTDVKVVNLFATVRDKKDQIVRNLTKDDFILDEDGRPQTIRYFSQESNLPLTVGLLIDTSGSTRRVLPAERNASEQFLRQVLRPEKDLAFIIHFDFEVELLQDLTGSRELLEKALAEVEDAGPAARSAPARRISGRWRMAIRAVAAAIRAAGAAGGAAAAAVAEARNSTIPSSSAPTRSCANRAGERP